MPAVPDDVEPGSGEDAYGVGVVVASVAGSSVEVGGPGVGVSAVAGEVGDCVAELFVAGPAEGDGAQFAGLSGRGCRSGEAGQGLGGGELGSAVAGGTPALDSGPTPRQSGAAQLRPGLAGCRACRVGRALRALCHHRQRPCRRGGAAARRLHDARRHVDVAGASTPIAAPHHHTKMICAPSLLAPSRGRPADLRSSCRAASVLHAAAILRLDSTRATRLSESDAAQRERCTRSFVQLTNSRHITKATDLGFRTSLASDSVLVAVEGRAIPRVAAV